MVLFLNMICNFFVLVFKHLLILNRTPLQKYNSISSLKVFEILLHLKARAYFESVTNTAKMRPSQKDNRPNIISAEVQWVHKIRILLDTGSRKISSADTENEESINDFMYLWATFVL